MLWTIKYSPTKLRQLSFIDNAHLTVLKYFSKLSKSSKPLVIIGPPGIGKTCLLNIIAKLKNLHLIYCTQESNQYSEFTIDGKRNIFIYEESIPKKFHGPSVILTNDYIRNKDSYEIIHLRSACDSQIILNILEAENIRCDRLWISRIVESMDGDYRSILNFLQVYQPLLTKGSIDNVQFKKLASCSPHFYLNKIAQRDYRRQKDYLRQLSEIHSPLLLTIAYNKFYAYTISSHLKFIEALSETEGNYEASFYVYDFYEQGKTETQVRFGTSIFCRFQEEVMPFLKMVSRNGQVYVDKELCGYYRELNDYYEKKMGIKVVDKVNVEIDNGKCKEFVYIYKAGKSTAVKRIAKMKDFI